MITANKYGFNNKQWLITFLLCAYISFSISPIFAQGDLLVYPKRVVLDGKKKIEKLVLSNTGKDTAVYNISFLEYKMNENGELKIVSDQEEGLNFASPYIRVFPRIVTLAPNEGQTVKVQMYNTHNLSEGEYRSHLYFRAEKNNIPLGDSTKVKATTIAVKLEAIFGITIACIVRKGIDETEVSISNLQHVQTKDKEDYLQFHLNRNGNMSTYGDFKIDYTTTEDEVFEVANMKGVGVYTPGIFRAMNIKLKKPDDLTFNGGTFKVVFTQNESKKVLTEAELKL